MMGIQTHCNEVIREIDPDFFKAKENPKAKPIKGLISFARNVGKDVEKLPGQGILPIEN